MHSVNWMNLVNAVLLSRGGGDAVAAVATAVFGHHHPCSCYRSLCTKSDGFVNGKLTFANVNGGEATDYDPFSVSTRCEIEKRAVNEILTLIYATI